MDSKPLKDNLTDFLLFISIHKGGLYFMSLYVCINTMEPVRNYPVSLRVFEYNHPCM